MRLKLFKSASGLLIALVCILPAPRLCAVPSDAPVQLKKDANAKLTSFAIEGLVSINGTRQWITSNLSLNDLYELRFTSAWSGLSNGKHEQRLTLFTPNNALYQEIVTPFSVDNGKKKKGDATDTVQEILPTAGSQAQRLPGLWKAEVRLDGQLFATQSFTLNP